MTENSDKNTLKYLKKVTVIVEDVDGNTETIVLDQAYDHPSKIKGAMSIGMPNFVGDEVGYFHQTEPLLTGCIVRGITDGPMNIIFSFKGRFGFNLERNVSKTASDSGE